MPNRRARDSTESMRSLDLTFSSELTASERVVWTHATSMEGVNYELGPLVTMSVPRALVGHSITDAPLGREAFVSTLKAFGVVPFDRHHLILERVDEGGFSERSWSWLQRSWWHDRTIEALSIDTCRVIDRVRAVPRLRLSTRVVELIVKRTFQHRHARLRRKFGSTV